MMFSTIQNLWKNSNFYDKIFIITIICFILLIPIAIIYRFSITFNKNIIIKEKYVLTKRNNTIYRIVSTNNDTYIIDYDIFSGSFDKAGIYAKINEGVEYNIKGYGLRIPILGLYPSIQKITLNNP